MGTKTHCLSSAPLPRRGTEPPVIHLRPHLARARSRWRGAGARARVVGATTRVRVRVRERGAARAARRCAEARLLRRAAELGAAACLCRAEKSAPRRRHAAPPDVAAPSK
eukprot:scaffold2134_cov384-Prasinococcus_capsulatus_cf.AAC.5